MNNSIYLAISLPSINCVVIADMCMYDCLQEFNTVTNDVNVNTNRMDSIDHVRSQQFCFFFGVYGHNR
jgi:hypothetical protein